VAEFIHQPHGEEIIRLWDDFCILYRERTLRPEIFEDEILSMQQTLDSHAFLKFWGKLPATQIEVLFLVFRDHIIIKPVLLGNLGRATYEVIECYPNVNDIVVQ